MLLKESKTKEQKGIEEDSEWHSVLTFACLNKNRLLIYQLMMHAVSNSQSTTYFYQLLEPLLNPYEWQVFLSCRENQIVSIQSMRSKN